MRVLFLGALALQLAASGTDAKSLLSFSRPQLPSRRDIERSIETLSKRTNGLLFSRATNNATAPQLDACPGYTATNVKTTSYSLSASLHLAGPACNVYGPDLTALSLKVTYETATRIHVKIGDSAGSRYEVPDSVLPRPSSHNVNSKTAEIQFKYTTSPFTFSIVRTKTNEVLFSTSKEHPLIFEEQYLRLKTASLPPDANIYGLGEHTETFRLPNQNLTRTLWSRDAYGVPAGTNLYGNHPIYFEHRTTGTHGVFLLSSNGMDIKINQEAGHTSLEYNVIGGIFDLYFLAGPSPVEVAQQYAQVVGTPAEVAYWTYGLHQCRYGYTDYLEVAAVVQNYTLAGIPLETMWTDIDLYYSRWTFTNDQQYFPLNEMRTLIGDLHARQQHYILMVDPAVAYQPNNNYTAYDQGAALDVFLKNPGTINSYPWFVGVVWPGMTVWPDWFHPNASTYWTGQFLRFFNKDTGIDVDGTWIDMNEPASFCTYPCDDPAAQAIAQGLPPSRGTPPPPQNASIILSKRTQNETGVDLLNPPYSINVATNGLSDRTAYTNIIHANGLTEYDTHNLYGTMMSVKTREALEARRPGQRTLVITRSTFSGAGAKVGKWLGDNQSDDVHYQNSISGILGFASIYQVPMVGADVCGYGSNTNELLCARWAMLGAFYPFYRNHNELGAISQEFYRWPVVTTAAKNAIDIRYRLIDYIYTAQHQAHLDGTPILNPLFFKYPTDKNTFAVDSQFFFGDSILVSPVTVSNSTEVTIYVPKDNFYDFVTYAPIHGKGSSVHLTNVSYTSIPLYIRGGTVLPLRASSANTTTELRTKGFEIAIAPGTDGKASGQLYIDDGISITQTKPVTLAKFEYAHGTLTASGEFGYAKGGDVTLVSFLGVLSKPREVKVNGKAIHSSAIVYDKTHSVVRATVSIPLRSHFTVSLL